MIYLNGINLVADNLEELHRFAYKVGVERSWYRVYDECYDVIDPFKIERIIYQLSKLNKTKKSPRL